MTSTESRLKQLETQGVDLSHPLVVELHVDFDEESAAHEFAEAAGAVGFDVLLDVHEDGVWSCECATSTALSSRKLDQLQRQVSELAQRYGGDYAGWGVIEE